MLILRQFRALVVELLDESEEHQVYQFLKGLKPEIQARTRTHKPATLAIAMDIADKADRLHTTTPTRDRLRRILVDHSAISAEAIVMEVQPAMDQESPLCRLER